MIPRIKELLHTRPFLPFTILTTDGGEFTVPTPDHAAVNPNGRYVVVFSDYDRHIEVARSRIAVVKQASVQE